MYENITYELLLQRMLNRVPSTVDKREGSIIYNALAPAAVELQNAYIELDGILIETFADTASRPYLIKRAAEKGITPSEATYALLKGEFNVAISIGDRFSLDSLNYTVTEVIDESAHTYKLKCETLGTIGNSTFGTLVPVNYIKGLNKAELTELIVPGEDEEDTESLRNKYFESLQSDVFGGNIADYKNKISEIDGVGGLKVIPHYNGGGTVKLIIINSSYEKPTEIFISELKEIIDPIQYEGLGVGIAPIGHTVTIAAVGEIVINISLNITYNVGTVFTDVKESIQNVIDSYLLELRKTWKDEEYIVIRISQIESRLLSINGIIDISDTKINELPSNLSLDPYSIPIRGEIIG